MLRSTELFPVAYSLMREYVVREKEVVEADAALIKWLDDKNTERETGMPSLPSWAVAADSFMPRGSR